MRAITFTESKRRNIIMVTLILIFGVAGSASALSITATATGSLSPLIIPPPVNAGPDSYSTVENGDFLITPLDGHTDQAVGDGNNEWTTWTFDYATSIIATATGSTTPSTASYPDTVTNGDFLIAADYDYHPMAGDGVDDWTTWTFDFTTDPNCPSLPTWKTLTSAVLTLTLSPKNGLITNDFVRIESLSDINSPDIQSINVDETKTVEVNMLDFYTSDKILGIFVGNSGKIPMFFGDDAIVSYARLDLTIVPEPFMSFPTSVPLTSALLTLDLTMKGDVLSTDYVQIEGLSAIDIPEDDIPFDATGTIKLQLLDFYSSGDILGIFAANAGKISMRYGDDAIVSYAQLTLSSIPEPGTLLLFGVGLISLIALKRKILRK